MGKETETLRAAGRGSLLAGHPTTLAITTLAITTLAITTLAITTLAITTLADVALLGAGGDRCAPRAPSPE